MTILHAVLLHLCCILRKGWRGRCDFGFHLSHALREFGLGPLARTSSPTNLAPGFSPGLEAKP